jgi:hypothetical protein
MPSRSTSGALLLLLLLAVPAAFSQQPDAATTPIDEITVTGYRPEQQRDYLNKFVLEIGDPVSSRHGFARWQQRLCVAVFNLPHEPAAQYLADRISLIAQDLGLTTGEPGCSPNLYIVFAPDARELASAWVDSAPAMFRPFGGEGGTTQGRAALQRFRTSEAAVRWWQVTMVVDELGNPAIMLPQNTAFVGSEVGGSTGAPTIRGIASKLRRPTSDVLWGSLVIVDGRKVAGLQWPQLAAYLAMVSLAQIEPDSPPAGYDSILNLFTADTPPPDLTAMDEAYLRALYQLDLTAMPQAQRGSLVNTMLREQADLHPAAARRAE